MRALLPILLVFGLAGFASAKRKPVKPAPVAPPMFLPNGDPNVVAAGAIAIDAASGKVLWAKDAETPRYMASTTKIMTAMLLIEHCKLDEIVVAPPDIMKTGESSMHLKPGEKVKVEDMLYALMLRSANDGCVAVADHVSGSVPAFVKLMNDRAKQIGCLHTHFANPNGLHDPQHYTTAHDLALIAREAMKIPEFRRVVKTWKREIDRSENKADRWMVSRNKWLAKDLTADGIKTGYTIPAGHCYVGSATRNNWRVITVVLDSDHWQNDHQALLTYAFDKFEAKDIVSSTPLGQALVNGGSAATVPVEADHPVYVAFRKGETPNGKLGQPVPLNAPIKKGAEAGTILYREPDGLTIPVKVHVAADVPPAPVLQAKGRSGFIFVLGAFILGGGAFALKRRARRKMRLYA